MVKSVAILELLIASLSLPHEVRFKDDWKTV